MTKIAFATVDWGEIGDGDFRLGGAGWARMGLPAKCLRELGDLDVQCYRRWQFNTQTLQFEMVDDQDQIHRGFDIVVFQRWMGENAPKLFQAAKHSGQVIVNDLDDWYWGLAQTNQAFWTSHPKTNPHENRNHYWDALGVSDLITVSTPYLAERIKKLGVRTLVLPNMVDLSLFKRREVRNTREGLTVGWVGGVAWRSGDLEQLKGTLDHWLVQNGASFYHGGAWPIGPQANDLIGVPKERYYDSPMVAIEEYPNLLEPIDIGIAPLNDVPFNRAKSDIKLKEYSAAGVPFIASAMPDYVAYGKQWTARRAYDWLRHLNRLADPAARRQQEAEQWQRVQREDIHARWADWVQILDLAVELRTKRAEKLMVQNENLRKAGKQIGIDTDQAAHDILSDVGVQHQSSTNLLLGAVAAKQKK